MMEEAVCNSPPEDKIDILSNILTTHIDVSRTSFSLDPSAKAKPLKIDFVINWKSVRVDLRNY